MATRPVLRSQAPQPAAPAASSNRSEDGSGGHDGDLATLLRSKVRINRNALDTAVEEQPELFRQAAEGHVQAVNQRDGAKDNLLRIDAQIALELRDGKFKDQKVTEGRINDEVLGDQRHLDAYADWAKKKTAADEWGALREAFDMRGKMLRELVGLYSTGYFGAATGNSARETYTNERAQQGREALRQAREARKT